ISSLPSTVTSRRPGRDGRSWSPENKERRLPRPDATTINWCERALDGNSNAARPPTTPHRPRPRYRRSRGRRVTRLRTLTLFAAIAGAFVIAAQRGSGRLDAQQLLAPSFTTA